MTRALKTSGFLGLAVMMVVGLNQFMLIESAGAVPGWMVGGHAHLGVLSILAIVLGFAVDSFALGGSLRTAVTGLFLLGQWLLPITIWVGLGAQQTYLMPTIFLWGLCLIVAMLLMAWVAWSQSTGPEGRQPEAVPADD